MFSIALAAVAVAGGCASAKKAVKGVKIVGDHIELDDHINFETGKADIKADSHGLLNRLATVLKASPNIAEVEINGHTDKTGDADFNKQLSQDRAAAVSKYLQEQGVTQKLTPQGHGQDKLLCMEETEECHAKNRRVEFIIKKS